MLLTFVFQEECLGCHNNLTTLHCEDYHTVGADHLPQMEEKDKKKECEVEILNISASLLSKTVGGSLEAWV